ncbi:MAG: hypothetical protein K2M60_01215, partial [Lachnospiraceae bacterium]|nr:hypothetical protein [Lachnospiraceae bacterium]
MAKIKFDKQHNVDVPTLLLQNRNFDTLGKINDVFSLEYKENFNSANELSFTVYKTINGNENALWDLILNNKIVFIPEFEERFVITVSVNDDSAVSKSVTGISLCESELSQIMLYNIEINTETDINRNDYEKTFFYNSNPKASILDRLLEKVPHYSIAHVDDSLAGIKKVPAFSISDKDIYSVLTNDIAEEFNCIFIFNSINRTISAYDLYNTCNNSGCGYRGDFTDKCPECGSTDFLGQYGNDTTIFITSENLANEITLEPDMDSFKNCMYIEGGDDTINAAIRSINPNGSNYIYYFNKDTKEDMSDELVNILNSYDELYNEYSLTQEYPIDIASAQNYNLQVDHITNLFGKDNGFVKNIGKLPSDYILVGYPSTTDAMYNAINLYYILNTSMMPTIDTTGESIKNSMDSIVNGFNEGFVSKDTDTAFINKIAITNCTLASQNSVERAIKKTARIFYGTAYYDLELLTSSYTQATSSTPSGKWIGQFKLTSLTETDENGKNVSLVSDEITLTIIENNELYIQQEINRAISNKDKLSEKQISNIKMSAADFQQQLHYYSLDELNNIYDMFESCQDVIIKTDDKSDMDDKLLKKYKDFYAERLKYIAEEKVYREKQIEYVKAIYYSGDSETDYKPTGILQDLRSKVNDELNIEKYIKKMSHENGDIIWKEFCSYRREDKYTNSNYISDGKTDSEIIELAEKLLDTAKKELFKAGTLQYSISTTMNNLLALNEFSSFTDNFDVGNWIRVKVNDSIYQLRLLSYEIDFDDMQKISVEFSTVEKIHTGYSDVESILSSVSSIASSYSGLVQQVDTTTSTANKVNNLVSNGLNATRTKFVDSDNEELVYDKHGLLGRRYNYVTDSYEDQQFKILSNGLYITSDNWKTITSGIGRISYFDPKKGEYVNDYGIIARTVVGNLFIGKELRIYGEKSSIILDENGITLDGGGIHWKSRLKQDAVEGLPKEIEAWKFWISEEGEFGKYKEEIKMQFDGKSDCTYGDAEPPQKSEAGDLWFCTDDSNGYGKNKAYMYDGSEWKEANGVPDSVWDIADSKSSIFVEKPCKPLSDTDLNYYHANDFWILENDMVLNEKEYKKGSIMVALEDSSSFEESHWTEKLRYTDDTKAELVGNELNEYKKEIKNFCEKVDNSLNVTEIDKDYIISPKIGGGHLYISKKGYGSVTIDPYQEKNNGYIFAVKNSDDNVVMGVDMDGNALFSGELKGATGTFSGALNAATGTFSGELNAATGTFMGDVKTGYTTNGEPNSPYN